MFVLAVIYIYQFEYIFQLFKKWIPEDKVYAPLCLNSFDSGF